MFKKSLESFTFAAVSAVGMGAIAKFAAQESGMAEPYAGRMPMAGAILGAVVIPAMLERNYAKQAISFVEKLEKEREANPDQQQRV